VRGRSKSRADGGVVRRLRGECFVEVNRVDARGLLRKGSAIAQSKYNVKNQQHAYMTQTCIDGNTLRVLVLDIYRCQDPSRLTLSL
jgi:hypothetical protein